MEKILQSGYQLYRLIQYQTKDGSILNLVLVLFNKDNDTSLLKIYVNSKVYNRLLTMYNQKNYDVSEYVKTDYVENKKDPSKSGYKPIFVFKN